MRSWNEFRHRPIKFFRVWKGTTSEKSERQTFWNEFFDIFGVNEQLAAPLIPQAKKARKVKS